MIKCCTPPRNSPNSVGAWMMRYYYASLSASSRRMMRLLPDHSHHYNYYGHQLPYTKMMMRMASSQSGSSSSSSSSSNTSTVVSGPTKKVSSWESGAQMVKNPTIQNQYIEHIRDLHDPSLHLKTIEDELKGTIGKALGKQGEKILLYLNAMELERKVYMELLHDQKQKSHDNNHNNDNRKMKIQKVVQKHNEYRKKCIQARWELIVHRQAVGFIVGNHKYVMNTFPIGDPLPEEENDQEIIHNNHQMTNHSFSSSSDQTTKKNTNNQTKNKFGDQLDWWERIGRWK